MGQYGIAWVDMGVNVINQVFARHSLASDKFQTMRLF